MTQEPEINHWTARRKAELIRQIYRSQTTVPEAARTCDLPQQEIEDWAGCRVRDGERSES